MNLRHPLPRTAGPSVVLFMPKTSDKPKRLMESILLFESKTSVCTFDPRKHSNGTSSMAWGQCSTLLVTMDPDCPNSTTLT